MFAILIIFPIFSLAICIALQRDELVRFATIVFCHLEEFHEFKEYSGVKCDG